LTADRQNERNETEAIRAALFAAILAENRDAFIKICNDHAELIFQQFDEWAHSPHVDGPEETEAWVHCLSTIAQSFEAAGYTQLMGILRGDRDDNPITRWENSFARAHQLSESGQTRDCINLLLPILDEMEGTHGTAVDAFRPKVLGVLGVSYFRVQEHSQARNYIERALNECKRIGDAEGVVIYAENLSTVLAADPASPTRGFRREIAKAQDLSDTVRYELSNRILAAMVDDLAEHLSLRAKAHGLMGSNYFRLDDLNAAREFTARAIKDCQDVSDEKGIQIYTENLRVIEAS